jgi:hypothetical protein
MTPKKNPAGLTGLATSALVIVAAKCGLDLSAEEAGVFVGLAVGAVSYFTPRDADA